MPKPEQKCLIDKVYNYMDEQLFIKPIGKCQVSSVTYSKITSNVYVNVYSFGENQDVKLNAVEFLKLVA